MTWLHLLHTLALLWMMVGVGAVIVPIWRAWAARDLDTKALLLSEAQQSEAQWLVPGIVATVLTGVFMVEPTGHHFLRSGWLLVKEILFGLVVFIFVPLMGVGLRRVRLLALQAQRQGAMTDELREALADKVPVVFGTVIAITLPIMVVLSVFRPF